ncbi:DUF4129 domain-containing protein [Pelagibius sp.]|uniref:DUF4129 domain-containing protein n=1 Tax=Pelagibius sp. TaxID=1931238 RepID=UPI003B504964
MKVPTAPRWKGFGWRLAAALMLLLVCQAFFIAPAIPQTLEDPQAVEEARDRILNTGRYQTERPTPPEREPDREPMSIPDWLIETILWTVAAIVVVMIAVFLYNALQNLSGLRLNRDRRKEDAAVVETPLGARQRAIDTRTLEEADKLAAAGRFAEAIHLLLLVAMDRLRRELGARVAPALTSREVLRLAPVPAPAAAPLERMVSLSEIKHFGGRDATAPDYDQCRADFLRFSGQAAGGQAAGGQAAE